MVVLSLFDGCGTSIEVLKNLGAINLKYYASEIDKYSIKIANKNHKDIIQLGDITQWETWEIEKPDLIIGGSPCQGFSFAGKQLNFEDERSKLFFEFVKIVKHYKPKYFLLENVKMKKEYKDKISELLEVEPIEIDSALVSAQRRKRLYWANFKIKQPKDRNIFLKDIVLENTFVDREKSYCLTSTYCNLGKGDIKDYIQRHRRQLVFDKVKKYIVPFEKTLKIFESEVKKNKIGYFKTDSRSNRVYSIHNKSVTLCSSTGGGEGSQNGQMFNEGKKFYTLTAQDQHGILIEGYIRKLTPLECERLQTFPDGYTEGVSDTQRYKMLGNSFTLKVIEHILKPIIVKENKKHIIKAIYKVKETI